MKLKVTNDSVHGLCVVDADTNDLVEGVYSLRINADAGDQRPMLTLVVYLCEEDFPIPDEDVD